MEFLWNEVCTQCLLYTLQAFAAYYVFNIRYIDVYCLYYFLYGFYGLISYRFGILQCYIITNIEHF